MFFELTMLGAIFYLGYRATRIKRPSDAENISVVLMTRAELAGAIGEQLTHAKLEETLNWLCGSNYYLHDGSLVIEHAPGSPLPTAEIDHLAITPFGIFVFETKHWSGRIENSAVPGEVLRTANDGFQERRQSPLAQNAPKIQFLRRRLPPIWPVTGAGVFTSPEVTLASDLPLDMLRVADLSQWLRTQREAHSGKPDVDVRRATNAILAFADLNPDAWRRHRERVKAIS
jgi:hypothetical protein